jgi:hypothetical protein
MAAAGSEERADTPASQAYCGPQQTGATVVRRRTEAATFRWQSLEDGNGIAREKDMSHCFGQVGKGRIIPWSSFSLP